jgi:hypothetical protein
MQLVDTKLIKENPRRVLGNIYLEQRDPEIFSNDLRQIMEAHLTTDKTLHSPEFQIMQHRWLNLVRCDLFRQLKKIDL